MVLSDEQLPHSPSDYYSRQVLLDTVGTDGQAKINAASVLIVGVGGLGSPVAMYLAGAGIGRIGLVDGDVVDITNLHRQVIHGIDRIGMNKAESGAQTLRNLNPLITITTYPYRITRENAFDIVPQYDLILDCMDNITSRYLLNDVCVLCNKTLVSAGALRWSGQLMTYNYPPNNDKERGPCFRCLHPIRPDPEMTRQAVQVGVMGVCPGVLGVLQAQEALRIVLGIKQPTERTFTHYDGVSGMIKQFRLRDWNKNCRVCGTSDARTINKDNIGMMFDV